MLPKINKRFTDTQTKKTIFRQCNTDYSTTLVVNTISYTGKFAKMVHQTFFGQNGKVVGVMITLTWKINDCRWWRYWQSEWQTIHSILPLILSLLHYFHSLLTAPTNAPPPKHYPNWGSNADDHSGAVWQSYRYAIQRIALEHYW